MAVHSSLQNQCPERVGTSPEAAQASPEMATQTGSELRLAVCRQDGERPSLHSQDGNLVPAQPQPCDGQEVSAGGQAATPETDSQVPSQRMEIQAGSELPAEAPAAGLPSLQLHDQLPGADVNGLQHKQGEASSKQASRDLSVQGLDQPHLNAATPAALQQTEQAAGHGHDSAVILGPADSEQPLEACQLARLAESPLVALALTPFSSPSPVHQPAPDALTREACQAQEMPSALPLQPGSGGWKSTLDQHRG